MKLTAFLFLFLSTVTLSAARADTDSLAGRWRGTYSPASSEPAFDLQIDESDGLYRAQMGGQSGMSFPVDQSGRGQVIRIVVPNVGIFQGTLHGDVLEGTFTGATGTGPFRLDKAPTSRSAPSPEPDFSQFVD